MKREWRWPNHDGTTVRLAIEYSEDAADSLLKKQVEAALRELLIEALKKEYKQPSEEA